MFCILLFVLSIVPWSQQHLTYPINFCSMASTCIHDGRVVCASSPDGCSRRSFLDQCDMYEYNCDYGTRYLETYILFCSTLKMSPQHVDILIDTSTNSEHTHPTTTKYTSSVTNSSRKYTSYIQFDITSNNTTKSESKFEDTDPCCDKQKTWESTKQTETTKIAFNESFKQTIHDDDDDIIKPIELAVTKTNTEVNNNYLLNDSTCNLLNVTDEKVTEMNYQMSNTTNILETTPDDRNIPVLLTKGLIYKQKDIINYTSSYLDQWKYTRYCCNRPKAWETTTETVIIVEENTKEIIDTIEENEVDNEEIALSNKVNSTTFNRTAYPFEDVSSTTRERAAINESDVLGTKISPYQVLTKRVKKKISKTSTFCNYHKCQRPLTWITTTVTKKRKLF